MWQRSALTLAFLAGVAFLATNVQAADHEMYYNCSRVPFCARLRTAVPETKGLFAADLTEVEIVGATTSVPLKNSNGQNLTLQVTTLQGGKYRVIIEEPNSHRYKVVHALAEEPRAVEKVQLHKQNEDYVHLAAAEDNKNHFRIRTDSAAGFSVEFYHNDVLQSSIDGSRLIIEAANDSQAFSFAVKFYNSDFLLGLAEHAQGVPLLHTADGKVDPYRLKNADNWAYEVNSTMAMYGSIPVIYSHGQVTSGFYFNNAAQEWVDIDTNTSTAYFMAEGGTLDAFVFMGPTIHETVKQYTNLTGVGHLPPQWTFGFQQSRWGYYSQDDVKYVINNFDSGNFSLDVIWLDFNWTNAGRYFEWEPTNYSDPIGLMNFMEEGYRKLVILNDPHIKIDQNYSFYVGAEEQKLFVNDSSGNSSYVNSCWPGNSSWLDFLNPVTRDYYASFFSKDRLNGTTTLGGIWNDMNEPALFDETIEKSLTSDLVQYQGVLHRDVHNIYGLSQTISTYQGLVARHEGKIRPFILTRSFFAGSQRFASMWTGDNTSDWPYIYVSWPMCMTLNLLGMAFCGADIGGFEGTPGDEMFIRWYQAGAWLPFMRAHSNIDSARREPYLWPNTTQDHLREAIQFRYKHVPIWYTQFYHHYLTGEPVVRPLFYNYPQEKNAFHINDEIMLGTDILARSVYEPNTTVVSVYFPNATQYWYQIANETQKVYKGNTTVDIPVDISFIPVFYRAGSIIPRKETVRKSSTFMQEDPFTLHVMLNTDNTAEGVLYIDDYVSFEYRYLHRHNYVKFKYDGITDVLTISELDPHQDASGFDIKIVEVMVHSINATTEDTYSVRSLKYTYENVPLTDVNFKLQTAIAF